MSARLARAIAGGIVILSLLSVAVSIPNGLTVTPSSGWNSKQVRPPKAAMYWSCLPTG